MPAFVACPGCGIKLAVPETLLGNRVRCSSCANVFEARADAVPPGPPAVPEGLTRGAGDLPEAPLDEPPPRRERPRDSYDYYPDYNEYDDYDDRERRERQRRYRRRDLAPHRGGMVL